jgi:hypothetical protein
MLCKQRRADLKGTPQVKRLHAAGSAERACDECGAMVLTRAGVPLDAEGAALARLAGFGLGSTGQPLLEPKREGA